MKTFTHAIVKKNWVEDDNDYAPRVTVFTFPSLDDAIQFRATNPVLQHYRIYSALHFAVPAYGKDGVQYEPHCGAGVTPSAEEEAANNAR